MTRATTDISAVDRIRAALRGRTGLYAPSVVAEAAELLADLLEVAGRHGVGERTDAAGWLVSAAADSIGDRYRRAPAELTVAEVRDLSGALTEECVRLGLSRALALVDGQAVAVAPVDGGPTWGRDQTGLAVVIYLDGGWSLLVNQPRTPVHTIYAPATADGAREVAELLNEIMCGRSADPFRRD